MADTAKKRTKLVNTTDNSTTATVFVKPNDLRAYYEILDNNLPIVDAAKDYANQAQPTGQLKTLQDTLMKPQKLSDHTQEDGVSDDEDMAENNVSPATAAAPSAVNANIGNTAGYNENYNMNSRAANSSAVFDARKQSADKKLMVKAKPVTTVPRDQLFNYTVVDPQGNTIPFVNISVPADALVTYARADGKFGLFSTDSVLNVNFKALGYQNKNVQLMANNNGRIVLEPEVNNNSDLVVVGTGKKREESKSAKPKVVIEDVEPIDGASNYDVYVANNLNPGNTRGEVTLVFDLDDNGEPINVKVDKSLNIAADAEAVRLVTQGPKWKSGKAKRSKSKKAKITITF
jgi:hypothetical protein